MYRTTTRLHIYAIYELRSMHCTDPELSFARLQNAVLKFSFINLFIVALIGLGLRSYPLMSVPLSYKYLLHAHSHFAFSGWIMPILFWMILKYFPFFKKHIAFRHWRNIAWLIFISAYGMLFSFPFQGYGVISIIFSTISILAGFYLVVVIRPVKSDSTISIKFLRAGLFYLVLSSIGPFSTGPLIAMGKAGSTIYLNAIYFYLHFQYNGWFTFAVLACLVKMMEDKNISINPNTFQLINIACIPSFFLSILWSGPSLLFNIIGGIAAGIQLIGLYLLVLDLYKLKEGRSITTMLVIALAALFIKCALQLLSAFPYFAEMAAQNRNFIIAYLHLVLLGFISMSIFTAVKVQERLSAFFNSAVMLFLISFVTTELLLVLQVLEGRFHLNIPYFPMILLICSCGFPLSVAMMIYSAKTKRFNGQKHLEVQLKV